jgi:CRP/FNR family cyclic AMP-dependent transcriptional regulator
MDRMAEKLAEWFGSVPFIMFHLVWFTIWIVLHLTIKFDQDWQNLTVIVSLEAIFLALFILRAENVQSQRNENQIRKDLKRSNQQLEMLKSLKNKR